MSNNFYKPSGWGISVKDGKIHCEDGPAAVWSAGEHEWYFWENY
jgi:hypothetical protein